MFSGMLFSLLQKKKEERNSLDGTWNQASFKQTYFEIEKKVVRKCQLTKCSWPEVAIPYTFFLKFFGNDNSSENKNKWMSKMDDSQWWVVFVFVF